jgi:putative glutamine amidotransferase
LSTRPVVAVTVNSSEFSWMLHWRRMFAGLQECGAVPLAVDCSVGPVDMEQLMGQVDGLVISGGGDVDPRRYGGDPDDPTLRGVNPVRDANEIAAFEAAFTRDVPTLAICRGAQLVNAHRGGTLYADLPRDRPSDVQHRLGEERLLESAHEVDIEPESRLSRWTGVSGALAVNSQHHQGIRDLAPGFVVTARATDGLVEGYESLDGRFTAVQWHPEVNWSVCPVSRRLLEGFLSSCARAAVPA